MLKIKSYILNSFCDWEDKVSAVIFLGGCNLMCRFCQNYPIVLDYPELDNLSLKELLPKLNKFGNFLDGIVVSGGEPTIHPELPEFIQELKRYFPVKLDTNGTNPNMLEELMRKGLLDYIALDIKAPPDNKELYKKLTGSNSVNIELIKESINLLARQNFIPYEFRTTVVPTFIDEKEIESIASFIEGAKKYVLQEFYAKNAYEPALRTISPYKKEKIDKFIEIGRRYVKEVMTRNYKWL